MSKKTRKHDLYLQDMIVSIGRIFEYTMGIANVEDFRRNFLVADAVARNFEIIGEAAKNVPAFIKNTYPHIPWSKMYQLRNIVSHAYFAMDHETIWEIVKNHLPQNLADLKEVVEKEKHD